MVELGRAEDESAECGTVESFKIGEVLSPVSFTTSVDCTPIP